MNLVEKLIELDAKSPKRIAVIGDVLRDIYVHGRLEDCQDHCQKFVEESRVECQGGAANAANCLQHWESNDECFGNSNNNAPIKVRFVDGAGKIVFRHDNDKMCMSDRQRAKELQVLWEWCPHAVLISDYDKGFLTPDTIQSIIRTANERGIPCVADAKREPELYAGVVLKCNADYSKRRMWLEHKHGAKMVVTRGADGPYIGGCGYLPTLAPVNCINHVGAGDCFAIHLTLALAHDFSMENATIIAHSAGRVYVQHPYNRPPKPEEIAADLDGR
jgi:bifunctional ADP-heptose synthase (sugar kinase/adenylyltransferase)